MQHLTPSTFADRTATRPPPPDQHDVRHLIVESDLVHTEEGASYRVSTYYRKGSPRPVAVRYGNGPIEWHTTPARKPVERKIAGVLRRSTGTPGGEPSAKIIAVESIDMPTKHGTPRERPPTEPTTSIEALQAQVRWLAAKVAANDQPAPTPPQAPLPAEQQATPLPIELTPPRLRRRGRR